VPAAAALIGGLMMPAAFEGTGRPAITSTWLDPDSAWRRSHEESPQRHEKILAFYGN
jgi:hypothetical protein